MDRFQVVSYWLNSAEHDFEVAETLFKNAKYDWCLFIGHLVLEKTLKAFYFKEFGSVPPRTHDLVRLKEIYQCLLEKIRQ